MFKIKFLILALLFSSPALGQLARQIELTAHEDSSYYNVYRLSNGIIWMGGESGIIKQIINDRVEIIEIPNNGSNILKITQVGNLVFLAADHGTLYCYDLVTQTAKRKECKGFENLCFYDILIDKQGNLLLCGGSSGIGKGKIRIPRGFIASIDQEFSKEPKILWSNKFQYVWSLAEVEDGEIAAAIYNGINTNIFTINTDGAAIHYKAKVKGLVHSLNFIQDKLMYCGSPSFRYKRNGTWGIVGDSRSHHIIKNSGFISGLVAYKNLVIGYSQQGQVFHLQPDSYSIILETNSGAVYEAVADEDGIVFVGHAKSCFKVKLE
jgi:hypothetical protein